MKNSNTIIREWGENLAMTVHETIKYNHGGCYGPNPDPQSVAEDISADVANNLLICEPQVEKYMKRKQKENGFPTNRWLIQDILTDRLHMHCMEKYNKDYLEE